MLLTDTFIGNDDVPALYNSNGHRCKELSELNFRNYILFAGDNINLGLDKPVEETVPYIVSKHLKTDYYNLSVFNGGIEVFKQNLINWFTLYGSQPPKCLVVSFEFLNAITVSDNNYTYLKQADYKNEEVKLLYHFSNLCGFFSARKLFIAKMTKNFINIPIYQISFENKDSLFDSQNVIDIQYKDDLFDYKNIADHVINKFNTISTKIKP